MEWLVSMHIATPADMDPVEHDRLYQAEAERAAELVAQGMLKRLWRSPCGRDNWSLWEAPDGTTLHAAISSFPLFRFMPKVDVHALAENHNDPGLDQARADAARCRPDPHCGEYSAVPKRDNGHNGQIVKHIPVGDFTRPTDHLPRGVGLTDRERQVLTRVALLRSTYEIATELHLSIHTVRTHLRNIATKLDTTRRADAVRAAQNMRLI